MNEDFNQYLELFFVAIGDNNFLNASKQLDNLISQRRLISQNIQFIDSDKTEENPGCAIYDEVIESCKLKIKVSLENYIRTIIPKGLSILPGFWDAVTRYGNQDMIEQIIINTFPKEIEQRIKDINTKLNNILRLKRSQLSNTNTIVLDDDHVIISTIDSYYQLALYLIVLYDNFLQPPIRSEYIYKTLITINRLILREYQDIYKNEKLDDMQNIDRNCIYINNFLFSYSTYQEYYDKRIKTLNMPLINDQKLSKFSNTYTQLETIYIYISTLSIYEPESENTWSKSDQIFYILKKCYDRMSRLRYLPLYESLIEILCNYLNNIFMKYISFVYSSLIYKVETVNIGISDEELISILDETTSSCRLLSRFQEIYSTSFEQLFQDLNKSGDLFINLNRFVLDYHKYVKTSNERVFNIYAKSLLDSITSSLSLVNYTGNDTQIEEEEKKDEVLLYFESKLQTIHLYTIFTTTQSEDLKESISIYISDEFAKSLLKITEKKKFSEFGAMLFRKECKYIMDTISQLFSTPSVKTQFKTLNHVLFLLTLPLLPNPISKCVSMCPSNARVLSLTECKRYLRQRIEFEGNII
ncbi:hypothetical protein WA158_007000 [Blastocystis sp. Blastoise]